MTYDESCDHSNMKQNILDWAKQFKMSLEKGIEYGKNSPAEAPRSLIWAGMGGSAIGGDVCASLASDVAPMPIIVHRGGPLPNWVGSEDRVLLASYSGNTSETLESAEKASELGCSLDIMTSGGKLEQWAKGHNIQPWLIQGGIPPRAALGYSFGCSYGALIGRGWCKAEENELKEAFEILEQLESDLSIPPVDDNHGLADLVHLFEGRVPMIYGMGRMTAVARRWAGQMNENAKRPAHWGELPEMNHNEVVPLEENSPWADKASMVILEDPACPDDILRRAEVTLQLAQEAGWNCVKLVPFAQYPLGQVLQLIVTGDWLSYWLAIKDGIDPTPIKSIDTLKAAL